MAAEARSTGRGVIGEIQAELWYYPVFVDRNNRQHRSAYGDRSIMRTVTRPKLETQHFLNLYKSARNIGFATLRESLVQADRRNSRSQ
jgi:hypothetical protein